MPTEVRCYLADSTFYRLGTYKTRPEAEHAVEVQRRLPSKPLFGQTVVYREVSRMPLVWSITADSMFLCPDCVRTESALIRSAEDGSDRQWQVVGNQKPEPGCRCSHCDRIA